jgi:hypothetical protein
VKTRLLRAAACAALLSCGTVAQAHEIGTTRVSAVFHDDRRYDIEIVTDAAALVEKIEAVGGPDRPFDEVFLQRVTVAFDGVAHRPALQYAVSPPDDALSPSVATIRLSGDAPPDARHVTWTYGWTFASYALSLGNVGTEHPTTEWLEGGQTSAPFALMTTVARDSRVATGWRYLALGFTHIVPYGLDHVLFVIGIFLLSRSLRSVFWQVSAFTVAHSITLGLSIYGVAAAPPSVVEPLIAVSIAYIAIENLLLKELRVWRIAIVFAFGLLHGMGFAGVLREIGLPPSEYLTALLAFNLGVEAGQLAVIAAALAAVGWQWENHASYRRRIVVPVSMLIACTAVYWTVQRVAF